MEYFFATFLLPGAIMGGSLLLMYQCGYGFPEMREESRRVLFGVGAAGLILSLVLISRSMEDVWLSIATVLIVVGVSAFAIYSSPYRTLIKQRNVYVHLLAHDPLPDPAQFKASLPSRSPWSERVNTLIARLYADEWPRQTTTIPPFPTELPPLPPFSIAREDEATATAIRWYNELGRVVQHFEAIEEPLKEMAASVTRLLDHARAAAPDGPFRVGLATSIPNIGWLVWKVVDLVLFNEALKKVKFAEPYRNIYLDHVTTMTELASARDTKAGRWLYPSQHPGSPQTIIDGYLTDTPLYDLFEGTVPFGYQDPTTRFEHTWIVAPPKSGKTTLLQAMIADDLQKVARGECSIIVMDSQEVMIHRIASRKLFDPVPLQIIDPGAKADFAINPFAMQAGDHSEADDTHLIELFEYMLGDILKADLTAKQTGLFLNIVRALMNTDGATIVSMKELLEGTFTPNYVGLDEETTKFMKGPFLAKEKEDTGPKGQLAWRIRLLLQRSLPLQRMLSHTRSDINFATQMNTPSVTLIRTNKDLLGNAGVEFFGRFCIAQILRAAYARRGDGSDLPCYVYIDEAQEYIKDDPQIPGLLDQVRKRNVGFVFANQRTNQLKGDVLDAMSQDVGTIIASRVRDANALAGWMECKPPDLITRCGVGEWMLFIRGQTDGAVRVTVEGNAIERLPRREAQEVRRQAPRVLRADRRPPQPVKESEEISTEPEDHTAPQPLPDTHS
jgi:hypothetical protein